MRSLFIVLLGLSFCSKLQAEAEQLFSSLPNWYSVGPQAASAKFNCRSYLQLAEELQTLPPEVLYSTLERWAERTDGIKIIPLCRMLYEAKDGSVFRAPRLGWGSSCPRLDKGDWPLEPIVMIKQIPFLISPHYAVIENAEKASEYLAYCRDKCQLVATRYHAVSDEELAESLGILLEQVGGTRKGTWSLFFKEQTGVLSIRR